MTPRPRRRGACPSHDRGHEARLLFAATWPRQRNHPAEPRAPHRRAPRRWSRPGCGSRWTPKQETRQTSAPPADTGTIRNSCHRAADPRLIAGGPFGRGWFFQQTICMFLWRFPAAFRTSWPWMARPLWYAGMASGTRCRDSTRRARLELKHELTRRVYERAFTCCPFPGCRDPDRGLRHPQERITVVPPGIDLRTTSPRIAPHGPETDA